MKFFSIHYIAFETLGYQMSWLELAGTLFGLWAVWMSAKEKVISWPIGVINVVLFFILFYQIQLYSDMFLQVYFFATNLYGWWRWLHPKNASEENQHRQLRISRFTPRDLAWTIGLTIIGTTVLGYYMTQIHLLLPTLFPIPAAFPYADTFIMVVSIIAQLQMTRKKIECWLMWGIVDLLATYLYQQKGVLLMSIEYFIFVLISIYGFLGWYRELQKLDNQKIN